MSGPMVRAILEGRKTMTRRVVKGLPDGIKFVSAIPESGYQYRFTDFNGTNIDLHCPYGRPQLPLEPPRDRLWVRETWKPLSKHSKPTIQPLAVMDGVAPTYETERGVCFAADGSIVWSPYKTTIQNLRRDAPTKAKPHLPVSSKWKPSIHMPRWASRITLEIVNVRVERLQEISEADCIAEGVQVPVTTQNCPPGKARILTQLTGPGPRGTFAPYAYLPDGDDSIEAYSRAHFASLWDSINAKRGYGWKQNPFVWVIQFQKL